MLGAYCSWMMLKLIAITLYSIGWVTLVMGQIVWNCARPAWYAAWTCNFNLAGPDHGFVDGEVVVRLAMDADQREP